VAGVSLLGSALLVGCQLDTRALELAMAAAGAANSPSTQPEAGAPSDGSAGGDATLSGGAFAGGASARSGAGGLGGEAGQSEPTVGGCADLDQDGVADCTQTIVTNPDFKLDALGWTADPDTALTWDAKNAGGEPPSGSALVSSSGVIDANAVGAALRAASQCVPVAGKRLLAVYANAWVDAGQDPLGHAEVDVFFFDADGCAGSSVTSFSTPQPLDAAVETWLTLKAGALSAETTKSALIKLAVSKPFRADSFQARFDNVLVRLETAQ
jgi:hypothetical protein